MKQQMNKQIYYKLLKEKESIIRKVLKLQYAAYPQLKQKHLAVGYCNYTQGIDYCISQMAEAIRQGEMILFTSYVDWAKVVLGGMKIDVKELIINLECLLIIFENVFSTLEYQAIKPFVVGACDQLKSSVVDSHSYINQENSFSQLAAQYLELQLKCEKHRAANLIHDAVRSGVSVRNIYLNVFECVQHEIGRLWQLGKISIAQEHYCTALTQVIIAQLYPIIFSQRKEPNGYKFLGTCMSNELHEMGIRMVTDYLEYDGWDTHYLGANIPIKDVLKTIEQIQPEVVALSATITLNISKVEDAVLEIQKNFGPKSVQIIVGGYPFNLVPALWKNIGADGYSRDAESAVLLSNELVYERKRKYEDPI